MLFEQAPRPPELLALLHTAEERMIATVAGLLAADPQVRVTDVGMAAHLVVGAIEGLVHRVTASGGPVDLDRFETELVAMITRYLTAPGG